MRDVRVASRAGTRRPESTKARARRVNAAQALRIAADFCVEEWLCGAKAQLGVGPYFGAPVERVWLVHPKLRGDRVGGSEVIAI